MAFFRCSSGGNESGNIKINGTLECECYVQDDFSQGDIIYGKDDYSALTVPIKENINIDTEYFYTRKKVITLNNGKKYMFMCYIREYSSSANHGKLSYIICELDENCAVIKDTVVYKNDTDKYFSGFSDIILNTEEDLIIEVLYKNGYDGSDQRGYLAFSFDLSAEELTKEDITYSIFFTTYYYDYKLSRVTDLRYDKPRQTDYLLKVGENAYVGGYSYNTSEYHDNIVLFYKTQQTWAYKLYEFNNAPSYTYMPSDTYGTADGNKFYIKDRNIFGVYNEETNTITYSYGTSVTADIYNGFSVATRYWMPLKDNYYLLYTLCVNSTNRRKFCQVYYFDFDNKTISHDPSFAEATTESFYYANDSIYGMHGRQTFWMGNRLFWFYKLGRIAELSVDYENKTVSKVNDFSLYVDPSAENLVVNTSKQGWFVYKNMFITTDGSRVYIYQIKNDSIKLQSIVTLTTTSDINYSNLYDYIADSFMEIHNNKLYMLYYHNYGTSGNSNYKPKFVIADIFSGNILKEVSDLKNEYLQKSDGKLSHLYDKEKNNFVVYDSAISSYGVYPPGTTSGTPMYYAKMISIISYSYASKLSREGDIFGIAIDDISKYGSGTVLKLPTKYNSLETEIEALSDDIEMLSVATDNMEDALDALLTSI